MELKIRDTPAYAVFLMVAYFAKEVFTLDCSKLLQGVNNVVSMNCGYSKLWIGKMMPSRSSGRHEKV